MRNNRSEKILKAIKLAGEISKQKALEKRIIKEKEYYENPKLCLRCNKIIEFKKKINKFCSSSCSAVVGNSNRKQSEETKDKISNSLNKRFGNNNSRRRLIINENCKQCNNILSHTNRYRLFCSQDCKIRNHYTKKIKLWLEGVNDGTSGKTQTAAYVKKYIIERDGNKCCECGWDKINKKTNKIPIHLDHIDGNWKNNNPTNLRLLCPNCHSLTDTYGSLNKGNGRPDSRKRY